jgi:nitrate reductase gamma subunit
MTGPARDLLLFAVLPYLALVLFFLGTILRYRSRPFSYSSLSSQFLENREHFWGLVSFHYGVLAVLAGHLLGLLIPRQVLLWNSVPLRLWVLEITGLMFALMTFVGLVSLLYRRSVHSRTRLVTSKMDWVVFALLAMQVVTGIYTAVFHGWGSSWFAASASPYLWSLFTLRVDVSYLATMPLAVKLHMTGAWLIVGIFPFTRLVHMLVAPLPYLCRKPEIVRWYGIRILDRVVKH